MCAAGWDDQNHAVKGFGLEDMKIEGSANGAFLVNTEDGGDYHDSGNRDPRV